MKSTMVQQYAKAGKGEKPAESESREISKRKLTLDELQEHNSLNQKAGEGHFAENTRINPKNFLQLELKTEYTHSKLVIQTNYMNSNTQKQWKFGTQIRNPNIKINVKFEIRT